MKTRRVLWTVVAVVAFLGIVAGGVHLWSVNRRTQLPDDFIDHTATSAPTQQQPSATPELAEDPVDWDALHAITTDVYAYIEMPQANISYPIVQREGDDTYYNRRDIYGNYSISGSILTEGTYNGLDFQDPVTIIGGHAMIDDGTMFGSLQSTMQSAAIDETATFTIYLPGRQLNYQIFAAVPYGTTHILHYNDFTQEEVYTSFFQKIMETKSLYSNVNEAYAPQFGDRVVMLMTCLNGQSDQRYLVMGKLVEEIPLAS